MTTAYQSPVGAIFVEPVPGNLIRLTIQQGRSYATLEIDIGDIEGFLTHIREAVEAFGEPPLMNVGPTSDVPLVCRKCAALVHPANDEFHQRWHQQS